MLTHRRKLLASFSTCAVLVAAICFLSAPSAPSESLLDPDDPQFRLSPPSSGEYYNVWDPANNARESHYNGVFQRGGPFERDLKVGGGRFTGSRRVYRVGNIVLGSGAAAQHAYASIISAIKIAVARAAAAHSVRVSHSHTEVSYEMSALSSREAELSASVSHNLASQSARIDRLATRTRVALVNHAHAIRQVRRDVNQLGHDQVVEDHRFHVLLNNQHALERIGVAALAKANSVKGTALRAEFDAKHAQSDVSRVVLPRILSLQRTHNENVAYILQLAHSLLKTNALVHDLSFGDMERIKADIESGSVRQDSLETLISLLSKHTDQRFVKVAKEIKQQGRLVEGVHKRMDRVEDEMTDTQSQMAAFKRKVKDDVGQLEKRLRALASKVATGKASHAEQDEEDEEEPQHQVHDVHHFVHSVEQHHHYHHQVRDEDKEQNQHHSTQHSEHSSEREPSSQHSGEKSEEHSGEKSEEHSGEKSEEHSGEKSEEHSGENSGER